MPGGVEMNLSAETKRELVRTAHSFLLEQAAAGTIDTSNPLEQLSALNSAWRDPNASWALASSLLRACEQDRADANGSEQSRSHTDLVYSVTLSAYDQARMRQLGNGRSSRLRSAA